MTREERWVIVGLAWLILFGCGVERWRREVVVEERGDVVPAEKAAPAASPQAGSTPEPARKIDVNHCDPSELESLPGIGPVRAKRIAEWRDRHGSFRSAADLTRVPGIGPKTAARIETLITTGGGGPPDRAGE